MNDLLEQFLERIRQDPELRRRLAQLLFGEELLQLAGSVISSGSSPRDSGRATPAWRNSPVESRNWGAS